MKKLSTLLFAIFLANTFIFAADLTVTGSFPGNNWVNNAADYKMTQIGTTNIYVLEKTLVAGVYEFKVFYSGTWDGAASGANAKITLASDKTVKFYAKDNGTSINFVCDAQELFVIGAPVGGWDTSNAKTMTSTSSDARYTADVVAGDFKIVSKDGTTVIWNFITPNNMNVGGSGNYTFKLDFATFTVTATSNGTVQPSITSLTNSYIFVGSDPATATWYNGSATFQAENFNLKNLGSITSPLFIGGEIVTAPVLSGVSVQLHYQINDLTVKAVAIPWDSNNGTTTSKWKSTAGTNVFADYTLVKGISYSLKVWFSANDGVATLWDSNNSNNYVATFTYDIETGLNAKVNNTRIFTDNGFIKAQFDGVAHIELFNINGQFISNTTLENQFTQLLEKGVYILKINGETHKILIR